MLIELNAQASLRQSNWTVDVPVGFGTLLADGDVLQVHRMTQILCADLQIATARSDQPMTLGRDICAPAEAARILLPLGFAQSLRKPNIGLPYLLSPRATRIREAQPLIRWNDTGRPPYTVTISAAEMIWSQEGIPGDSFRYPGTPPLTPGTSYVISVRDAAGHSSDEEGAPGLSFQLIDAEMSQQVASDLVMIDGLGLSSEASAYARAWLLASQGLTAEAIDELRGVPTPSAATSLALGDFNYRIRLPRHAGHAYQAAVAQARAANDHPLLATALVGLGNTLTDDTEITAALSEASSLFASFGDSTRVAELAPYIRP